MDPVVMQLIANLNEATARQSAAAISTRVSAITKQRDDKKAISELEGIIHDLVSSRDEVILIAQGLKNELVAQQLSDKDISYIVSTIIPAIRNTLQTEEGISAAEKIIQPLEKIISEDTLRVLQILGFNYRDAIGRPLTELVKNILLAKVNEDIDKTKLEFITQSNFELYLKVIQDEEASSRLREHQDLGKKLRPNRS